MPAQIGYAQEVTVGTPVTVTRFIPLVSESIQTERERLESAGIIGGRRVLQSLQWNGGNLTSGGDIQHELYTRGLGLLFSNIFGTVVTSGAGPYVHTFTPGDLLGKALTVQVGRPGSSGTVYPFTYAGCKVQSAEIACSAGEIATLGLTVVGMTESTATGLAVATYPTGYGKPFKFNHGSVTIGGVSTKVKSATITIENGLDDGRRFIGQQTIDEPLEADYRMYGGTLDIEFTDLTHYNRFVAGTEHALVLNFTAGTESLVITCNVRFDGETPAVGGRELLRQGLAFKCISTGADSTAITAVMTNSDVTP